MSRRYPLLRAGFLLPGIALKNAAGSTETGRKSGRYFSLKNNFVYSFGGGSADGNGSMKNLLGGKGANLAEMARIGLPVPPGFTITTEVCTYYYDHGCTYPAQLDAQIKEGIARMEQILGRKFGDTEAMPMLVAVRSGARESMPGMMDTILNLGLNEKSVEAMVKATGNPRFAWDCYRRFVQMKTTNPLKPPSPPSRKNATATRTWKTPSSPRMT